ncbi:MAG: carboxypeptidase regulatory-like domain-containing protein, partial [Candidatus Thermoplasmatota archaeon]
IYTGNTTIDINPIYAEWIWERNEVGELIGGIVRVKDSEGLPLANASVIINGEYVGKTNLSGDYKIDIKDIGIAAKAFGRVDVEVYYEGRYACIEVSIGDYLVVDYLLNALDIDGIYNDVEFYVWNSTGFPVNDAKIFIDNVYKEKTVNGTCTVKNVSAGEHEVHVVCEGFFDVFFDIYIEIEEEIETALEIETWKKGYVYDANTFMPIEGAWAYVYSADYTYWNCTQTDANGSFKFNLSAGSYEIYVWAEGYYSYYESFCLKSGEIVWNYVYLKAPIVVCDSWKIGYVYDKETYSPIVGACIYVSQVDICYYWNYTFTDDTGYFNFSLPHGDYCLYIYAEGYYSYYENFTLNANETNITRIGLEKYYIPEEDSWKKGYVYDKATNNPIEGAYVYVYSKSETWWYYNWSYTNATGYFELRIPHGSYYIYVWADGYYSYYGEFSVKANATEWNLVYLEKYYIPEVECWKEGRVYATTGGAIANAYVYVYSSQNESWWFSNWTYTDSTGYFKLGVPHGSYYLYVWAEGYYSYYENFTIHANQTKWNNISLEKYYIPEVDSWKEGYVYDSSTGNALKGAYVYVYSYHHWYYYNCTSYYNYTSTDENGYFKLGIPHGNASIYVYLSGYSSYYEDFVINKGETLANRIALVPYGTEKDCWKKGYVLDNKTTEGIKGAWVYIWSEVWYYNWSTTNEAGYYEFHLPHGKYYLYVYKAGYEEYYEEFVISATQELWNNITLTSTVTKDCWKKGYVYDNVTKQPIRNAEVTIYSNFSYNFTQKTTVEIYNYTYYWDFAYTDEAGYFEFYLPHGRYGIYVYAQGYVWYCEDFNISEGQVLWNYIYLEPYRLGLLKGYVYDSKTGSPIPYASIYVSNSEANYWNYTYTNETGYYEMYIPYGHCYLSVSKTGYYSYYEYFEMAQDVLQKNIRLDPVELLINVGCAVLNSDWLNQTPSVGPLNDVYFIALSYSTGVSNVSIKVFDSQNNTVFQGFTDSNGTLVFYNLANGDYTWKAYYLEDLISGGSFVVGPSVQAFWNILPMDNDDYLNDFIMFGYNETSFQDPNSPQFVTDVWVEVYNETGVLIKEGYTNEIIFEVEGVQMKGFLLKNLTQGNYTFKAYYQGVLLSTGKFYSYGNYTPSTTPAIAATVLSVDNYKVEIVFVSEPPLLTDVKYELF